LEAAAAGEKFFELDLGDGPFTARSMKRLEKARLHVQDELQRCGAENSSLSASGVTDLYLRQPMFSWRQHNHEPVQGELLIPLGSNSCDE
jgi:hypothetical protein